MISEGSEGFADLNEAQRTAVEHGGSPLLVLAGPGSGKTRVIVQRIGHRVCRSGIAPEHVVAITFTQRAAREMRDRLDLSFGLGGTVRVGTFHWFGHSLLRRSIHRLGLRRDFRLLGATEARRVLREAAVGIAGPDSPLPYSLAHGVSAVKNGMEGTDAAARHGLDARLLSAVLDAYDRHLRGINALDLDDLLLQSVRLLREDGELRARCHAAIGELLVDEYQDTNPIQQALLQLLLPDTGGLTVVGDADQAIYSWRLATSDTIVRFDRVFEGSRVVKLEQTYRSTKHILRAAGSLIQHNRNRLPLTLRAEKPAGELPVVFLAEDERDEAEWLARRMQDLKRRDEYRWSDIAVLYRINAQSRAIEDALIRAGIPYRVVAGRRFYERAEIRAALAHLRLALDPGDDDAAVFLLEQIRGLGPKRLGWVRERAVEQGVGLLTLLGGDLPLASVPHPVRIRLEELLAGVGRVSEARSRSLRLAVEAAVREVLGRLHEISPDDPEDARENLDQLLSAAQEQTARRVTLRAFADRLTLGDDVSPQSDAVDLLTLHAAKGTEFAVVFIAGLEEGLLPHRRSLDREPDVEEERRLCYVGITRAKNRLFLSSARSRFLGGQALFGTESRFIGEMGRQNVRVELSERVTSRPRLISVDVGERVRHPRWQDGTVVNIEGSGRTLLVTVAFDRAGSRRLQLCHAPLTRLVEGEKSSRSAS